MLANFLPAYHQLSHGRDSQCCLQRWPNTLPAAVNTNFTKQRNSDKKAFLSVNLIFFPL